MDLSEYREHTREELNTRRDEGTDVAGWMEEHDRLTTESADDVLAWREILPPVLPGAIRSCGRSRGALGPRGDPAPTAGAAPRQHRRRPHRGPDRGGRHGRIAGCILGKPVEGKPKNYIDRFLAAAGPNDLDDFFPRLEPVPAQPRPRLAGTGASAAASDPKSPWPSATTISTTPSWGSTLSRNTAPGSPRITSPRSGSAPAVPPGLHGRESGLSEPRQRLPPADLGRVPESVPRVDRGTDQGRRLRVH